MEQKTASLKNSTTDLIPAPIHCIITVHGMGEPKYNSTLLPVVEQIVQSAYPKLSGDTLTLGGICGLTGDGELDDLGNIPCFAIKGIRLEGDDTALEPTYLHPTKENENLFFADIFWSDITKNAFDKAGDSIPHWTECLINRLERQRISHDKNADSWWVMDMLYLLRRSLVVAEKALSFRAKDLSDMVFGQYLGDVQLYGEFPQVRAKAIRLFHEKMATIHNYLTTHPDQKVHYTFLAHSLGTVMTMDALTFAHNQAFWKPEIVAHNSPELSGYDFLKPLPNLDWIDSVNSFITLGSPIDKFLTLWWFNYAHLSSTDWIRPRLSGQKIRHYNFCDEQDPVGQKLDFARSASGFSAIFTGTATEDEQWNDVVYNHTPIPGMAHTSYWKDRKLFKLIYTAIIRGDQGQPKNITQKDLETFQVYRRKVYTKILFIHYYLIPILWLGACHFSLTLGLLSQGWHTRALGILSFVLCAWYGRTLVLLNIGWRRALKQDTLNAPHIQQSKSLFVSPDQSKKIVLPDLLNDREIHAKNAIASWWLLSGLGWTLSLIFNSLLWEGHSLRDIFLGEGMVVTLGSSVIFIGLLWAINSLTLDPDTEVLLPSTFKANIKKGRNREIVVILIAILPIFLAAYEPLRNSILSWIYFIKFIIGHPHFKIKREYLIFFAVLSQLSAIAWAEVLWLYHWMKIRFAGKSMASNSMPPWQRNFDHYAMKQEVKL